MGHPYAQFNYALMAYEGEDITQDLEDAYFWICLAEYFEVEDAETLKEMIAEELTPESIEEIHLNVINTLRENGFE